MPRAKRGRASKAGCGADRTNDPLTMLGDIAPRYDYARGGMLRLRAFLRDYRSLALAVLAAALLFKALVPAGFMVSTAGPVITVTLCTESTGSREQVQIAIPGKKPAGHADSAAKDGHCAFAGLAKMATGGTDPVLLALAIAFILVLGLAPVRALPVRQSSFLRPPLRGPPAAA